MSYAPVLFKYNTLVGALSNFLIDKKQAHLIAKQMRLLIY